MRLLLLAITFSLMLSNAAFADSEEDSGECEMDEEIELLAIINKERSENEKKAEQEAEEITETEETEAGITEKEAEEN